MKIHHFTPKLSMIELAPPISGWQEFIEAYVIKGRDVAIIDVGPQSSANQVIEGLVGLGIDPGSVRYVLLTHIHIDHSGAIGEVMSSLPRAEVVVHPKGVRHLADGAKLWQASLDTNGDLARAQGRPQNIDAARIISAENGMRLDLGEEIKIEVIHTLGHAAHHMSFLESTTGALFAGEAAGVYTPNLDLLRVTTPPPASVLHTLASIDHLLDFDVDGIYYAHFGYGGSDAKGQLIRAKKQILLWEAVIGEHLARHAPPEDVLSELMKRDPNLANLEKLPTAQYLRERHFIGNSINGLLGYLKSL